MAKGSQPGKWRGSFTVSYSDGVFKNALKTTSYGHEWSFIQGVPPYCRAHSIILPGAQPFDSKVSAAGDSEVRRVRRVP